MKSLECSVKGCRKQAYYCHIDGYIFWPKTLDKKEISISFLCMDHDTHSLPLQNKQPHKILRNIKLVPDE